MNYSTYYGSRPARLGSLWQRQGHYAAGKSSAVYRNQRTGYQQSGRWPGYASTNAQRYRQTWPSQYASRYGRGWNYGQGRGWNYSGYGANTYGAGLGNSAYTPHASQWVLQAQNCLAQLVGGWVPQSGMIGRLTRKAIRIFQSQQQLPVTGILDRITRNALQAACSGSGSYAGAAAALPPPPPPIAEPEPMPPPDDAAMAAPPPLGDAPVPDGAPDAPPPDAPAGEIGRWRRRRLGGLFRPNYASQPDAQSMSGGPYWSGGYR